MAEAKDIIAEKKRKRDEELYKSNKSWKDLLRNRFSSKTKIFNDRLVKINLERI